MILKHIPTNSAARLAAAAVICVALGVSPPAFAQSETAPEPGTIEAVEAAYLSGDHAAARAGLIAFAEDGNAKAQYRLGYMLANAEGGPGDRLEAIKWLEAALAQEFPVGKLLLARTYLSGAPEVPDYERAVVLLTDEIENQSAEAGYYLGQLYRIGRGVEPDKVRAYELLRASANAGVPNAQFAVAQMYSRGEGIPKDDAQSTRWLLQSAEGGYPDAQLSLYFNYSRGTGFPKDEAKSLAWLIRASESGSMLAERILGGNYLSGVGGVEANPELGVELLLRAGNKGDPGAQSNLGYAYYTGLGVDQDFGTAIEWYRKAADQRLTRAALALGSIYDKGEVVERDVNQALKYYEIAYYGRDPIAAARLGEMYVAGELPDRDGSENSYNWAAAAADNGHAPAREWLLRIAQEGEPFGWYRLAIVYENGYGVDVDHAKSVTYFRRAAESRIGPAQERLSEKYGSGEGTEQDFVEAHKWANVAASQGSEEALKRRDILATLMTSEQIAEAQSRARAFIRGN